MAHIIIGYPSKCSEHGPDFIEDREEGSYFSPRYGDMDVYEIVCTAPSCNARKLSV